MQRQFKRRDPLEEGGVERRVTVQPALAPEMLRVGQTRASSEYKACLHDPSVRLSEDILRGPKLLTRPVSGHNVLRRRSRERSRFVASDKAVSTWDLHKVLHTRITLHDLQTHTKEKARFAGLFEAL